MGCFSDRERGPKEESQKWDFITLSDFKCTSAWTVLAYIWLWFLAMVGIAVFVVDTFTAVNLLAFDSWTSQVKPALDMKYSKWIFSICILLSWVLAIYEWIRALRVIKRGGVAQSFLDPLAVDIQSMRPGGFKRFLVFAELTKSRKGADYVALFVYFSFKTALRVILAEGPRQAVNAMTLYAVLQADLIPTKATDHSKFEQFFLNIGAVWDHSQMQAVIYFSMLFTLIIWVFSALSLIIAAILYITFLWHYVPQRDGTLSTYCRRKVDKRLERIVAHKVKAAIEEEERKKRKEEVKAEMKRQKTGELPPASHTRIGVTKKPTLPNLGTPEMIKGKQFSEFTLQRSGTGSTATTLPPYSTVPPSRDASHRLTRQPTLPDVGGDGIRPSMSRFNTGSSGWSKGLLSNAAQPGDSEPPLPPMPHVPAPRQDSYASFQQPWHERSFSQSTHGSVASPGPSRNQTPVAAALHTPTGMGRGFPGGVPRTRGPPPMRNNAGFGYEQAAQSPVSVATLHDEYERPGASTPRSHTPNSFRSGPNRGESYSNLHGQASFDRSMPRMPLNTGPVRAYTRSSSSQDVLGQQSEEYEMTTQPFHSMPVSQTPAPSISGGYFAFDPARGASTARTPMSAPVQDGQRRNLTIAGDAGPRGDYFGNGGHVPQRCATAPIEPRSAGPARGHADGPPGAYPRPLPNSAGFTRPDPPVNPVQQRAYTAGPRPTQQNDWARP